MIQCSLFYFCTFNNQNSFLPPLICVGTRRVGPNGEKQGASYPAGDNTFLYATRGRKKAKVSTESSPVPTFTATFTLTFYLCLHPLTLIHACTHTMDTYLFQLYSKLISSTCYLKHCTIHVNILRIPLHVRIRNEIHWTRGGESQDGNKQRTARCSQ